MNHFVIMGRVGHDPELKTTSNGTTVVNFSLATNNGKDKKPTWHRLTAFNKTADVIRKYVTKGQMILVEGNISNSKRTIGDKEVTQVNLFVNRVEFCGGGEGEGAKQQKPATRSGGPAPIDDDDIPF